MTTSLLEQANQALAVAREEPTRALEIATTAIKGTSDIDTLATAHFACGLAYRTLAETAESTRHLEQAAQGAMHDAELRGKVLRSLAFNYAQMGKNKLADTTVNESILLLTGQEQDVSRVQQAFMLIMRGDLKRALPVLDHAIDSFSTSGDDNYLELTLYNRALIHMESGDADRAIDDLERAYDIATNLEHQVAAADAALHISQALGWRDDIPGAMKWHARAARLRGLAGVDSPIAEAEHAYVLIQARLMAEAEKLLTTWLPRLVDAGDQSVVISAHLQLAEVLLSRGDYAAAADQVNSARQLQTDQDRYRFDIAAADHKVRVAAGDYSQELLESMLATAQDMDDNGEKHAAALERFRAIELALILDNLNLAREISQHADGFKRSGPLWLQVEAWTALARVRMASGDPRGTGTAVKAGLSRLDEYRTGIGSADLRIHAADLGAQLAEIGIELAMESGSAVRVFAWVERLRTTAAGTPTDQIRDRELESALIQLRHASSRTRKASGPDRQQLQRDQTRIESQVRQLARQSTATNARSTATSVTEVREAIDGGAFVQFVEADSRIAATVVDAATTRLIRVGPSLAVAGLLDHLRLAAERIARPSASELSKKSALDSVSQIITTIRERLVVPLSIDPTHVVIAPTPALHGVPWGLVFEVPTTVVPSAAAWLRSREAKTKQGEPVVVFGPGLDHAAAEAATVQSLVGGKVTSQVGDALQLLAETRLAHFACHARPRLDSPMFSSLVLDDGELTLYDLERLDQPPTTVVLAACDGGSAVLASGDEVLGIANAFLGLGTKTVIAPIFTVSDEATAAVMSDLHQHMASGRPPAEALLATQESTSPLVAFTAGSYLCFGA